MILNRKTIYRATAGSYKARKMRARKATQESKLRQREALDEWFGK